jgi:DNA polymerase (family 10)
MENRDLSRILNETADLLEISAADSFRIRSYRRASEAMDSTTEHVASLLKAGETRRVLAIPNIGKGMVANLTEIVETGELGLHRELLAKYHPRMLELLKLPGCGPKTVALFWETHQIGDIDSLEAAARSGKLDTLPRFSKKSVEKLLKGIDDYRKNAGRVLLSTATQNAEQVCEYFRSLPGVTRVEVAGSLRRGRETIGDVDILVTGPCCGPDQLAATMERAAQYSGIATLIARGENKISFNRQNGLQVDVRLLPEESYGAALQYFTGSKMHNVALRQRAVRMGFTLSEYSLAKLIETEDPVTKATVRSSGEVVASRTEHEIYAALGLDWIPPELREDNGEIEAAEKHTLPHLIEMKDIRGDVHMHTEATDGRNTIREMAEAAIAKGYEYIAITDHSKNLAMTNGLDDARALAHIKAIRQVDRELEGSIRVLAGIEVDILGDGELDLSNEVLAQMDVVIGSVHTLFAQPREEMTARLLRAIENPNLCILGHLTGRLLLRREPYALDLAAVLQTASAAGVVVEHNASPSRLDLCDRDLRAAHKFGCKIAVNTDAHHTSDMDKMPFGLMQLRRAWLTAADVLNTRPLPEFLAAMRRPAQR